MPQEQFQRVQKKLEIPQSQLAQLAQETMRSEIQTHEAGKDL